MSSDFESVFKEIGSSVADVAVETEGAFQAKKTSTGLAIGSLMGVRYKNPYRKGKEDTKADFKDKNLVLEFAVHGEHNRTLLVNCVFFSNQRDVLREGTHLQIFMSRLGFDVPAQMAKIPENDYVKRARVADELRKADVVPVIEKFIHQTFCFELSMTKVEQGKTPRFIIKPETIDLYTEDATQDAQTETTTKVKKAASGNK